MAVNTVVALKKDLLHASWKIPQAGRQPRICEVALINRVLRGQVSGALMAFNPSHLKAQSGCWNSTHHVYIPVLAISLVFQEERKKKKGYKEGSKKLLYDNSAFIQNLITLPSLLKGRRGMHT